MEETNIDFKIVENLYSDTREWLKFAESKNAALLTLNLAYFWGIIRHFVNDVEPLSCLLKAILILILTSLIINLFSFLPRKVDYGKKDNMNYRLVNFLHYSEIAKLDLKRVQEYIGEKYYNKIIKEPYYNDLTKQIYSLSVITVRKNTYFKDSLIITSLSFFILMVNFIL